jgi:exodeoxyribonuclease V alpha subunit
MSFAGCIDKVLSWLAWLGRYPSDAQAIAPTRKTCQRINLILQERLNPATGRKGTPRIGDRIVNGENRHLDIAGETGMHFVANGDQGVITDFRERWATVLLADGVSVECYIAAAPTDWDGPLEVFDGWGLAYCITVYKAQGSEWPVVIFILEDGPGVDRNLVYTAISRTREHCVLIGDIRILERARKRRNVDSRVTLLPRRIAERRRGG